MSYIREMSDKEKREVEKLIKLAQKGNAEAFGKVYKIMADHVYRFAVFKTGDVHLAEDIVNETFRRVWVFIKRYKAGNFKAYVFVIARNLIYESYKRNAKQVKISLGMNMSTGENHLEDLSKKMEVERIMKAVEVLPDSYREVIVCRFIEELSIKETATVTGKTSANVRILQHRAIKKMHKILS